MRIPTWFLRILRSIGLWQWHIKITITVLDGRYSSLADSDHGVFFFITVLDIIHLPVFYLKQDVSENGFCLCLQAECTQMHPIEIASLCRKLSEREREREKEREALSIVPNWVGSTSRWRHNPVSETSCFEIENRAIVLWILAENLLMISKFYDINYEILVGFINALKTEDRVSIRTADETAYCSEYEGNKLLNWRCILSSVQKN
jgi:hypothetical protein